MHSKAETIQGAAKSNPELVAIFSTTASNFNVKFDAFINSSRLHITAKLKHVTFLLHAVDDDVVTTRKHNTYVRRRNVEGYIGCAYCMPLSSLVNQLNKGKALLRSF